MQTTNFRVLAEKKHTHNYAHQSTYLPPPPPAHTSIPRESERDDGRIKKREIRIMTFETK